MKKFVLGMPSLVENTSLEKDIVLCEKLRLSFVEINMNFYNNQAYFIDVDYINSIRKNKDIFFTIHLDDNFNPFDFNNHISTAYIESLKETIDLANKISSPLINMHMNYGTYITLPTKKIYQYDVYIEEYMQRVYMLKNIIDEYLDSSRVKIHIENTNGFTDVMQEAIIYLLNSNHFLLTLDVGHKYCADMRDSEFYKLNENKLKHMHIHDVLNGKCHAEIGKGILPIYEILSIAKKTLSTAVIEVKTINELTSSVNYLNSFIKKNFY